MGHISPEAAEGGPIALGGGRGPIVIDVPHGRIDVDLTQEELDIRRAKWTPPQMPPVPRGYPPPLCQGGHLGGPGAILQD